MKTEFEGLINRCWADGSPILAYVFFELDHDGKMDWLLSKKELRKNWTDFIIETNDLEPEKICGYCGSENIHPENTTHTICWDCNSVFKNEDIGCFVA